MGRGSQRGVGERGNRSRWNCTISADRNGQRLFESFMIRYNALSHIVDVFRDRTISPNCR